MKEGGPKQKKSTIETIKDENGVYVKAQEIIKNIPNFEEMSVQEKVTALTAPMEVCARENNLQLAEALAKEARAIEIYSEIQTRKDELERMGMQVDTYV